MRCCLALAMLGPAVLAGQQRAIYGTLEGRVVIRNGGGVSPANVVVVAYGPYGGTSTRPEEDGRFHFRRLSEGRYTLRELHPSLCLDQPVEVLVYGGRPTVLDRPMTLGPCRTSVSPPVRGGVTPTPPALSVDRCRPTRGQLTVRSDNNWTALTDKDSILLCRAGVEVFTLVGHTGRINAMAFSRDGRFLASASSDSTARLWSIETGRQVRVMREKHELLRVFFSPDGRTLAAVDNYPHVNLFDINSGLRMAEFPLAEGWQAEFSTESAFRLSFSVMFPPSEHKAPLDAKAIHDLRGVLEATPGLRLRVEGHADPYTEARSAQALSRARAEFTRQHLASAGIPAHSIATSALADSYPVCRDAGERCAQQNRRAVIAAEYRGESAKK